MAKPDQSLSALQRRHGAPARSAGGQPPAPDRDAHELALVSAHRAGDASALSDLLTAYQDRLFGICWRMLGNRDEARDLTQDSLVRIIQGLPQFDGRSKVSTWMIRIAMNACLTHLRRKRLRRHVSLESLGLKGREQTSDNLPSGMEGPGPRAGGAANIGTARGELSPRECVESQEETRRLLGAISKIDAEQRALLILRDLHGLDYRRIGEVLDIPEGTVKSRLFRARAALRARLSTVESGGARSPVGTKPGSGRSGVNDETIRTGRADAAGAH